MFLKGWLETAYTLDFTIASQQETVFKETQIDILAWFKIQGDRQPKIEK